MKITLLNKRQGIYSSNVYFIEDSPGSKDYSPVLVDTGPDDFILEELSRLLKGRENPAIRKIIITHGHFDHCGGLELVFGKYKPRIYSFNKIHSKTILVKDGMEMEIAGSQALLLHIPCHSPDSICIYCKEQKALFSGDLNLEIKVQGNKYGNSYIEAFERLLSLDIENIYPGHQSPIIGNAASVLYESMINIKKSMTAGIF